MQTQRRNAMKDVLENATSMLEVACMKGVPSFQRIVGDLNLAEYQQKRGQEDQ